MFVTVAIGTAQRPYKDEDRPSFSFAPAEDDAIQAPAIFDRLALWGFIAIGLALIAYAGPIHDQLTQHHYLAPGMRTW
jgi:hypothetical protein